MSLPLNNTTGHSALTDPAQDPQTGIDLTPDYDSILASMAAKQALHQKAWAQSIEELRARHPAPQTSDDPITLGVGHMCQIPGGQIQDPKAVKRRTFSSLLDLFTWFKGERRIGPKYAQPNIYAGVPVVKGDSHKANCAFAQVMIIDLDTDDKDPANITRAIRDAAGFDTFKSWLRSKGAHFVFSSASHNPRGDKWCVKAVIALSENLNYEELAGVGLLVRLELADLLKPDQFKNIDQCTQTAMQPQLVPAWPDQDRADQEIINLHEGAAMDVAPYLAIVRAELAEKAQLEAVKEEARKIVRPHAANGAPVILDDGSVDKLDGCRQDLRRFPIVAGAGERNKKLPVAVGICLEWDLDAHQAERLMLEVYGAAVDEGGWVSRWVETIYSKPDTEGRRGRRLSLAQTRARLSVGGVIDLGGACVGETNICGVAPGASPTHSLYKSVDELHVGKAQAQPGNEPTYNGRTITVHTRQLPVLLSVGAQVPRVQFIRSPTGTGKSYTIQAAVAKAIREGQRVGIVVPRRSLARAAAKAYGIPCYLDLPFEITGSCVICLDSVCRIQTIDFATLEPLGFQLLVLDEMQQLARHRVGGTLKGAKTTEAVHKKMKELCQLSEKIRAQDADLSDLGEGVVRQWLEWAPGEGDWERLINTCKAIDVITYTRRDEGAHLEEMWRARRLGHAIAEFCTSKNTCEAHAAEHLERFPTDKILVIDGDTPGCQDSLAFLADPTGQAALYHGIYFTGALQTGVSIEVKDRFRMFATILAMPQGMGPCATDVYQGLSRVRYPIGDMWHICMMGSTKRGPEDAGVVFVEEQIVKASSRRDLEGVLTWRPKYGVDGIPRVADCDVELLKGLSEVKAYENYYGGNFHDTKDENGNIIEEGSIPRLWREKGLPIVSMEELDVQNELAKDPEQVKAEVKVRKARRKTVKVKKGTAATKGTKRTLEEVRQLEGQDMTPEIRADLDHTSICFRYGLTSITLEDYLWDKNGGWSKVCNFAEPLLVQRGEVDALRAIDAKGSGLSIENKDAAIKAQHRAAWWAKFGITDFSADALAGTVIKDPGRVLLSKANREYLRIFLGMSFKTETWADGMVLVRSLARAAGLRLKEIGRDPETRKRIYVLAPESVAEMIKKSQAHYDRLFDPAAAKLAPVEVVGPTLEDLQVLVAAMLEAA